MNKTSFIPDIDPAIEEKRIVEFLKNTFASQNINNAVIGLSGGIDSMTSFFLLKSALTLENIFVAHLYYDRPIFTNIKKILDEINFPQKNVVNISIQPSVEQIAKTLKIESNEKNKIRIGNVAARVRMLSLFDLAKKEKALVVGTENKSENLLGYFTRFGDQASDIEPIEHLYKTQVYKLAKHLSIPDEIINQQPSAGLWEGQTDEGELGFSYEEADNVLFLNLEKKMSIKQIEDIGLKNAKKILEWRKKNLFKHQTPYTLI